MGQLITHLIVIASLPLMLALAREGWVFISSIPDWPAFAWVGLGVAVSIPIHVILYAGLIRLVGTMEHELCHLVAKYLFLGWVEKVSASKSEGGETVGWPSNALVSLAPYFLPVLTLPFLGIRLLVAPGGQPIIDLFIGVTLGLHYLRIADDLRSKQTDFTKAGLIPSLTITPVANIIFLVIIAAGILNDYRAVTRYFAAAVAASAANYDIAWRWLQDIGAQLKSLIS